MTYYVLSTSGGCCPLCLLAKQVLLPVQQLVTLLPLQSFLLFLLKFLVLNAVEFLWGIPCHVVVLPVSIMYNRRLSLVGRCVYNQSYVLGSLYNHDILLTAILESCFLLLHGLPDNFVHQGMPQTFLRLLLVACSRGIKGISTSSGTDRSFVSSGGHV